MLIIKYSFTVRQGKRKLCECHTRFFFNKILKKANRPLVNISILILYSTPRNIYNVSKPDLFYQLLLDSTFISKILRNTD